MGGKGLIAKINFEPTIVIKEKSEDINKVYFYGNFINENKGYLLEYYSSLDRFYTTFENVTGISEGEQMISSFTLSQNYPNPFNPSTTIKFSIPNLQFVTLKVYDILGRELATLVNEEKLPGNYEVKFNGNGNNLSSGVYFYRLQSGSYSDTKKFILMK